MSNEDRERQRTFGPESLPDPNIELFARAAAEEEAERQRAARMGPADLTGGTQLRTFQLPPFSIRPANPQMGVDTPSSRGLFPWKAVPPENLKALTDLAAERAKARRRQRRNAFRQFLGALAGDATLQPHERLELASAFPELAGEAEVADVEHLRRRLLELED